MSRPRRTHEPGGIFHVISRGNDRQAIFLAAEDFEYFLSLLSKARSKMGCRLFAYCLMPNHFHLLIRTDHVSLSRIMHYVLTAYARRFNLKFDRCGHVFENRFKAIPCRTERYFLALLRYIHLNPVRAGLVSQADSWRWSGHGELIGSAAGVLIDSGLPLRLFAFDIGTARSAYAAFLNETEVEDPSAISSETIGQTLVEAAKEPIAQKRGLGEIAAVVSLEQGIPLSELISQRKLPHLSEARKVFVSKSIELGFSAGDLARFLNRTPSAISKILSRMEKVNKSTPGTALT